jgi:hypothetical protein
MVYVLPEDTASVAVALPPAPPTAPTRGLPVGTDPPWPPSTSTVADVTPAGGVHDPTPEFTAAEQVTVIVVVPDSVHAPIELAAAGAEHASKPTATATVTDADQSHTHEGSPRPSKRPAPNLDNNNLDRPHGDACPAAAATPMCVSYQG